MCSTKVTFGKPPIITYDTDFSVRHTAHSHPRPLSLEVLEEERPGAGMTLGPGESSKARHANLEEDSPTYRNLA